MSNDNPVQSVLEPRNQSVPVTNRQRFVTGISKNETLFVEYGNGLINIRTLMIFSYALGDVSYAFHSELVTAPATN